MTYSSCLTNNHNGIALDSSVIINLIASGHADAILAMFKCSVVVSDDVYREIERGELQGHGEFAKLLQLISKNLITVETLSASSLPTFFSLVSGETKDSLGDGEAATLALSLKNGYIALIDEKKATRIAGRKFPNLRIATTVDLLASALEHSKEDRSLIGEATLNALRDARMQVKDHQFDWVCKIVGIENAQQCRSLARFLKRL